VEHAVDQLISDYITGLSYVKSVDGFLIKTSTLIYGIEDYCSKAGCDPSSLLEDILRRDHVRKYLKAFACYRDNILSSISSDPRYKNIRKYEEIIRKVLSEIECEGTVSAEISVETPPALWVKEAHETIPKGRPSPRMGPHRITSPQRVSQILLGLLVASIILFIIYLLLGGSH
jgi:hypothetical protein